MANATSGGATMIDRPRFRLAVIAVTALFGLAVSAGPMLAAGDPEPQGPSNPPKPPPPDSKKKKKQTERDFIEGYKAARALVLDGKYAEAIAAFKALDHDDRAEVANYIGYASRKLGDYEAAKVWYER